MSLKKIFLVITGFALFGCNCYRRENPQIYNTIKNAFINSNEAIEILNNMHYYKLINDTLDPMSKSKANYFLKIAMNVKEKSKKTCNYIKNYKSKLNITDGSQISKHQSNQLYKVLNNYITEVLTSNKELLFFKKDSIVNFLQPKYFDENTFYNLYFLQKENEKENMLIYQLINDIKLSENRLLSYCATNYTKLKVTFE